MNKKKHSIETWTDEIIIIKKRNEWNMHREQRKKREKRKQLNYAFGRHSQHIITQILANTLT